MKNKNWHTKYKIHSSVDGDDVFTALMLTTIAAVMVLLFVVWRII